MVIPGYRLLAELSRGTGHVLFRAEAESARRRVLLKVAMPPAVGGLAAAALSREHSLIGSLAVDGVPRTLGVETHDGVSALVLEDDGGTLLAAQLAAGPLPLQTGLRVVRSLAATLAHLHRLGVVHKQVNPHAVLVDPETAATWLVDFAFASRLSEAQQSFVAPHALQGRLAYMSPEQTGRMNRVVDYRTDFYSLGATLYHVLTGVRPFQSDDPLELMHWHIARQPVPPHEVRAEVPEAVSQITMKLLEKTVERRYQSATGIVADLDWCLEALERQGDVPAFDLAARDTNDRFTLPQALYGREAEVAVLMQAFDHACDGPAVLMLVEGYSGVGKTALVQEVHKPMLARSGRFLAGKFDQLDRSVPYGALIQALRGLMRQLLAESPDRLGTIIAAIREAVGPSGAVLEMVMPEVTTLLGPQPPVPPLGPTEAQNRFGYVFQSFLSVFARPEHPLVIFLDDLQWADRATLALLTSLLTSPAVGHLLVIGAYRDNEVGPDHVLARTIVELRAHGARVRAVTVPPLQAGHLAQMIGDALASRSSEIAALAELVHEKTGGNAFFARRFLQSLYGDGLVAFDHAAGTWRVDVERIRRAALTDNVVDLMSRELDKLPADTTRVVTLAACVGNTFALSTLVTVCEWPPTRVAGALWPAIRSGLIVPLTEGYERLEHADDALLEASDPQFKFLHDRVQQAAYARIPPVDREPVHLGVGRLLLAGYREGESDEALFEIANHLNVGAALITDADERVRVARLNLAAGRRAKASAAFQPALVYFDGGLALLPSSRWTSHYDLALPLAMEQAECAYLCAHFDRADRTLDDILEAARSPVEKAEAQRMRIVQQENLARYAEAVDTGREALALFGLTLPEGEAAVVAALDAEFARIRDALGGRSIDSLVDLPVMQDQATRSTLALLTAMWAPAYVASLGWLPSLLSALIVRLSLEHGNTEDSAYGYVTHAIGVGARLHDQRLAHDFGRLALAVNDRFADLKRRAKVHHMFSCFVNLWREPIATCMPHAREAHRTGVETGDFTYASYAVFHESWYALLSGMPLDRFLREYEPSVAFLRRIRNDSFADAQQLVLHWGLALRGDTRHPTSLSDDAFDENRYAAAYAGNAFFQVFLLVARLHLAVSFGDLARAQEAARAARRVIASLTGTIWTTLLDYYEGLMMADLAHVGGGPDSAAPRASLEARLHAVRRVATDAPANFSRYALLLAAEAAALDGAFDTAVDLYAQAARASTEAAAPNDEAFAMERHAMCWRRRGNERVARALFADARERYAAWGAVAKVRVLDAEFPEPRPGDGHVWLSPGTSAGGLDLATVMKASRAIASELDVERLVDLLLLIAVENAGAERGALIEDRDGDLVVVASGEMRDGWSATRPGVPLAAWPDVPQGIVRLVQRTAEFELIDDAASDRRWFGEAYVAQRKPRSVLALPVVSQGRLLSVIYLENNLSAGVFTPERVAIMRALAGQAAISLVNARLLREKTAEIAQRTEAEAALRDALAEVKALKDRLQAHNLYLQEELQAGHNFDEVIGRSPALLATLGQVERVAATGSTVLLVGATGTGKEIVARAIHSRSPRRHRPLVKVDCGAIPAGLVESELFGHVRGAFTGALQRRTGRFELADGGTIFLDEVGELPLETQVKLLRVLQEQEFEPVGSTKSVKVDVRVIAATNRDLETMVHTGAFRADLFYRLNVFPIAVPLLRDRREDIPLLVAFFLTSLSKRLGKPLEGFSARSMERLLRYDWPGNVRELQNVVERAAILAVGPVVDLERDMLRTETAPAASEAGRTLEDLEKAHILSTLQQTGWTVEGQKGAAGILGLHPNTLRSRMKKLGIRRGSHEMS